MYIDWTCSSSSTLQLDVVCSGGGAAVYWFNVVYIRVYADSMMFGTIAWNPIMAILSSTLHSKALNVGAMYECYALYEQV